MTEVGAILAVLKRALKARGMTYGEVAKRLGLSEPSVKRLFSTGRISLDRLAKLAGLLDLTLAEIAQEAAGAAPVVARLTQAQEAGLVADPKLLLVAVLALNHWSLQDIIRHYRLDEPECLALLLRLDRLGIVRVLPGNKIRPNVARDFDWLPDGPLRHFFRTRVRDDFLAGGFEGQGERFEFAHGMLTPAALAQMHAELRRLRRTFAELHADSLRAPLDQRQGFGLLFALRSWEPAAFAALRRAETKR
jgi:transcriptional regulator with XRE-family HTH domain